MAGGSTYVIVIALFANLAIAIAKLVVAIFTGSGAMMAESIHSFADAGNQGLLLVGEKRARRPADQQHPLGYGRESYFWALLVAMLLFTMGGAYSLYEGIHKLRDPHPISHAHWAVAVLVFAIVVEGGSCLAAWREFRRRARGKRLFAWARSTGNVNLLVVVFEDLAALFGLFIALVAVLLSWITNDPIFDAIGTCVLGVLLLLVALFLASQVRRLIVGFSAGPVVRDGMIAIWDRHGFEVTRLAVLWCGPDQLLVVGQVRPRDTTVPSQTLVEQLDVADREVYRSYPEVRFHFVEPDFDGDDPEHRG